MSIIVRIVLLVSTLLTQVVYSQSYGASGECLSDDNVNCSYIPGYQKKNTRATVLIVYPISSSLVSYCTGTILNQHVSQGELKQYVLTARHCTKGKNFSKEWEFNFNYQSSNCDNSGTLVNHNGSDYHHSSKVRLVAEDFATDMALIEILKPIPAQFNIYYSGWSTSYLQAVALPNYVFHHPGGDIKKASRTHSTVTVTNHACHTTVEVVERVIQFLFGWIIKKEINIRKICTYTESPRYLVSVWDKGVVEPGSSGSALINNNTRVIGALSGGLGTCGFSAIDQFGRFNTFWHRQKAVRDALAPIENQNTGWRGITTGLDGRQVICRDELVLKRGDYHPASNYQSDNKIILQASGDITSDGLVWVESGADFDFKAGGVIDFNNDFYAEPGSKIYMESGVYCNSNPSSESYRVESKSSKPFLEEKKFELSKYLNNSNLLEEGYLEVFPTRISNEIIIRKAGFGNMSEALLEVLDVNGVSLLSQKISLSYDNEVIPVSSLNSGIYFVKITLTNGNISTHKVIKE